MVAVHSDEGCSSRGAAAAEAEELKEGKACILKRGNDVFYNEAQVTITSVPLPDFMQLVQLEAVQEAKRPFLHVMPLHLHIQHNDARAGSYPSYLLLSKELPSCCKQLSLDACLSPPTYFTLGLNLCS